MAREGLAARREHEELRAQLASARAKGFVAHGPFVGTYGEVELRKAGPGADGDGDPSPHVFKVVGHMKACASNFFDAAGKPAALWRIEYEGVGDEGNEYLDGRFEELEWADLRSEEYSFLCEYEQRRRERIARNKATLEGLGFPA